MSGETQRNEFEEFARYHLPALEEDEFRFNVAN